MSFDFNYKFWVATKKDIEELIKRQNVLKKLRPIQNPLVSYKLFSELYVLYSELVNKLGYVYNTTYQVQKRKVVRSLVEATTRRLMELKNELKNLELNEYVYIDKAIIARKLTPYDLMIWRSPNFLSRRPPELENIVYDNKILMNEEEKEKNLKENHKLLNDAIILIQSLERARKARVYRNAIKYNKSNLKILQQKKVDYKFNHKSNQAMSLPVKRTIFNMNFFKPEEHCQLLLELENMEVSEPDANSEALVQLMNQAAIKIQTFWRAYKNRKLAAKKKKFNNSLYGLTYKRSLVKPNLFVNALAETYKNEKLKEKLDADYLQLMTDEHTRFFQERSPWIMEDISDHIRDWFREFYEKVGDFHPYPDVLKSGTVLVLIDETLSPIEYREKLDLKNLSKDEKKKLAEKAKNKKIKEREKMRKEKMKEAKRRKKMKAAGIIDIAHDIITNKNIKQIEETMKNFNIDWRLIDEYLNKNHEAIKEWITEEQVAIVHRELRALVDEYMRLEYELLRQALCKDLKKPYRPPKIKKPKKEKRKKRKKKAKDITEDRSLESLFNELKDAGIIEKRVDVTFNDFIADFNFTADDTRDEDHLTTLGPAKGDLKMVIQDCIMGMGEFSTPKPKSLCLIGPVNNGKKLLCNIVSSELDAIFMDLSPEKTQYFAENLNYLMNVVMKVAKAFQPTVLFIENVHRLFWKKIPPDQVDLNPRLLQTVIKKKILKNIKPNDRIMLLGTSDTPWSAKATLKKCFQKFLLVPFSDYGTSFLLWLYKLEERAGEYNVDDYVISALSKSLQKYNSGDVSDNINDTLSVTRRMKLRRDPINPQEFVDFFINNDEPLFPLEDKITQKYEKWFKKANAFSKLRTSFYKKKMEKQKKK